MSAIRRTFKGAICIGYFFVRAAIKGSGTKRRQYKSISQSLCTRTGTKFYMKYSNHVVFTATSSHCRSIALSPSSSLSFSIVPSGLTSLDSEANVFSPIGSGSLIVSASGVGGVNTCAESDGSDVASSFPGEGRGFVASDEGATVDPSTRSDDSSDALGAAVGLSVSGPAVGPPVVGLGVGPGLDSWPICGDGAWVLLSFSLSKILPSSCSSTGTPVGGS